MIKTHYIELVLFATLLAGCTPKQNLEDHGGDGPRPSRTATLTVTLEPVKAAVDGEGKMTWQTGDQIAVLQGDLTVVPFTLSSGAGTAFATFTGELTEEGMTVKMAGYPYWAGAWQGVDDSGADLVFSPPASGVAWRGAGNVSVVMKGAISGESVNFSHLGGVLHFPIKDIPPVARKFKFSTSGNAVYGKNDFIQDFTPASGVMDFYIPVSPGTMPSYTVSLCDASGNTIVSKTKSSSTTIERCELRSITPLQVVESNKLRIIEYNVLEGMKADEVNNYDNFVAWVQEQSPDILVLCESKSSTSGTVLNTIASRWGHSYTAVVNRDSYPVVVTSSRPMSTEKIISNGTYVSHGAVYVTVAGLNLVGLHLRPTQDKGTEQPNKYEYYGAQRVAELNYILGQTINSEAYSSRTDWVFLGDCNMYAYSEKSAVTPLGGSAYYYPDYEGNRSVAYDVYDNMIAAGVKDVLYDFNGGIFQPTMYHAHTRLDYIFASPSVYSRVRAANVIRGGFPGNYKSGDNTNPSDHLPLIMDLSDYAFHVLDGKYRLEDWGEEDLISENLN